jgi:hypothetical protein
VRRCTHAIARAINPQDRHHHGKRGQTLAARAATLGPLQPQQDAAMSLQDRPPSRHGDHEVVDDGIYRAAGRSRRMRTTRRLPMRLALTIMLAAAALQLLGARPSGAQYAAQLYPYCSLSASNGATNCYVGSREECGRNVCISNPWYIGRERARPYLEGRRRLAPRYLPP